jgi:hypothetical protein
MHNFIFPTKFLCRYVTSLCRLAGNMGNHPVCKGESKRRTQYDLHPFNSSSFKAPKIRGATSPE